MKQLKITFSILLSLFINTNNFAHSGKANIHIIIDTDGGIDDLRAISLILSSPNINVHGFVSSDGVLSPEQGVVKLKELLTLYHHEGLPIAEGYSNLKKIPVYRNICNIMNWGDSIDYKSKILNPERLINNVIEKEKCEIIYVCLGSLYNISHAISVNKDLIPYIKKIIWFNGDNNTNQNFCKSCRQQLINQNIKIETITNNDINLNQYIDSLLVIKTIYSKNIIASYEYIIKSHEKVKVWDDYVALYLRFPEIFTLNNEGKYQLTDNLKFINSYVEILNENNTDACKVFKKFPLHKENYNIDIKNHVDTIIEKYGYNEWRSGVITNELHGHLGIYAIIGTKMGIRVREYFRTGVDDIEIVSMAGSNPPISCLNDGLQVSTGATVGHGLIKIPQENDSISASARFCYRGQTIEVTLKPEYKIQIKNDIITGIIKYGTGSDNYWMYIRNLAINYWKEWSRYVIFDIKIIDP